MNRFVESISYLKKSVKLKKELDDKRGMANAEQNLANNYMGLGDLVLAEKHFKNAIAINQEMDNSSGLITNYFNIGRMYAEIDPKTAISYFNKGKILAVKIEDMDMITKIDLEILNLTSQNQRLRESRDILLPRLMMGMIDVD